MDYTYNSHFYVVILRGDIFRITPLKVLFLYFCHLLEFELIKSFPSFLLCRLVHVFEEITDSMGRDSFRVFDAKQLEYPLQFFLYKAVSIPSILLERVPDELDSLCTCALFMVAFQYHGFPYHCFPIA